MTAASDASDSSLLVAAAGGAPLLFRQLFDAATGTFSYLLADVASGEGVLIDPVFEQHSRDLSLIQELGIRLVACLDTHAHADHVTGSWLMHQATGSAIAVLQGEGHVFGAGGGGQADRRAGGLMHQPAAGHVVGVGMGVEAGH